MKKIIIVFTFIWGFIIPHITLNAQNTAKDSTMNKTKMVAMKNGTEYIGEILSDDGREILLNSLSIGKIYLTKSEIKEITDIASKNDVKEGVYVGDDIFATRYFISTNGFTVKKKDTYVMLSLFGPEFQKAITDRFSLGIMTTWGFAPFAATGKYSMPIAKNTYWGAGFIAGSSTWIESFRFAGGLLFSSLTYGDRNYNISGSLGYGFLKDFSPRTETTYVFDPNSNITSQTTHTYNRTGNALLASLAGTARLGRKASFILENFYYNDSNNKLFVMIPGFRFSNSPNRAFQFGVAGVFSKNASFPLPMASWFFKIN